MKKRICDITRSVTVTIVPHLCNTEKGIEGSGIR